MSVFVSYSRPDEAQAKQVYKYLVDHGVTAYLDIMDPSFATDTVTAHLLERLRATSHLMAVVSDTTRYSWWVPFEIGVATDRDNRIATYTLSTVQLPHYLQIWPILRSNVDLARFVTRYSEDRRSQSEVRKFSEALAPIQSAARFHQLLKTDIGQR